MYTITTSAGDVFELTYAKDYIPGSPQFHIVLNGEAVGRFETISTYGPREVNGKTIVGLMDLTNGKKLALTQEQVNALHADADANRDSETRDRLAMNRLRSQREHLVRDLNGHIADAAPDDLYDSEYEHINLRRQKAAKEAEAKIPAARAALDAFDIEHPEVIEAVRKERAEAVERNRWN